MFLIIDADTIAYQAAFAADLEFGTLSDVHEKCDQIVGKIFEEFNVKSEDESYKYQMFLTGDGNFRIEIAKFAPYKGNRKGSKPRYLPDARAYLEDKYYATVVQGIEADDAIGILAASMDYKNCIVVGIDKDFHQFPTWHFNYRKEELWQQTPEGAQYFIYKQMMTGDSTDNIKGAHLVGPKKADGFLEGLTTEEEMWQAVVKAYKGDESLALENARLVWLQRYEGQLWTPPAYPDQKL